MKKIALIVLAAFSVNCYSFDLEDYAGVYRETRNAKEKALISFRLSEDRYITMREASKLFLPMPSVALASNQGVKLNKCTYWETCNSVLTQKKVLAKIASVNKDPIIVKMIDSAELERFSSEVNAYYDQFDPNLHTSEAILFEEQASYVTQYTAEYVDGNGDSQIDYYGTSIPGSDPEDYYANFRQIRNAYFKADNELKLSRGPAEAAQRAYAKAVQVYLNYDNCSNWGPTKNLEDQIKAGDIVP